MSIAEFPTLVAPIEDELDLIDHEFEALVEEANERRYATEERVDGLPPSVGRLAPDTSNTILGEGSEPELRPDEKVCEVTGYTYYAGLSKSPHVDEEGRLTW